jgi:hypothetical protein
MDSIIKPTKQQVREWLKERRSNCGPLPDIEQIRLQLGWKFFSQAPKLS